MSWYIDNGRLTHEYLPEPLAATYEEPFSYGMWYVDNGRLAHTGLRIPSDVGAFMNALNLVSVRIPESVKDIGTFAFTNTALTSVTIAHDCQYNEETSFPDGCTINFYPT